MERDLALFNCYPAASQKNLVSAAETMMDFQANPEIYQHKSDLYDQRKPHSIYYQKDPSNLKKPGALLIELGILTEHRNKVFALWVKNPRSFKEKKPLKYRLVVVNKKVDSETIAQCQRITQVAKEFQKTYVLPKYYPSTTFANKPINILKFYPHGDLLIQSKLQTNRKDLFVSLLDLITKIKVLHSNGYAHVDIKPENIFIDAHPRASHGICILGDLETLRKVDDRSNSGGTTAYLSPEFALDEVHDPRTADIWGLGCILFFIYSDKKPLFQKILKSYEIDSSRENELKKYLDLLKSLNTSEEKFLFGAHLRAIIAKHIPPALQPLLIKMLNPDPKRRISAEQVLALMNTISPKIFSPPLDVIEE
ncbi:MAG: protein kinase domain-containing protein [Chlamydiia bacterium]